MREGPPQHAARLVADAHESLPGPVRAASRQVAPDPPRHAAVVVRCARRRTALRHSAISRLLGV